MADNPIKHDDLIQPGNPFDQAIKGLTDMIKLYDKLLKDIRKSAKEQIDVLNKLNVATKQGQTETKRAAGEVVKLSAKEKEMVKIQKQLVSQKAKLSAMNSKEYQQYIKNAEAIKRKSAEMRKMVQAQDAGRKSTNTWGKALGSFATKFNSLGNIISNVASVITRTLRRAITSAMQTIIGFDQAMADVKSITRATGAEFDKLRDGAKRLGATTRFTAVEVAGLQKEYAKLGLTTQEILNAQEATLMLAAATGTDLARAAEVVGITLNQFGLDASEATRVVDVMTRSFTTSALDTELFAEAMKMAGPAARASGLSFEKTTAMLAQLADAGIRGTMAGTALRNIMLNLSKGSGTLGEKIAALAEKGLTLSDASDEVQRRAAVALIVLANGVGTIDDFTAALERSGGAAEEMANVQLDTLRGQLIILKSAWDGLIISLGDSDGAVDGTKTAIGTLSKAVQLLTNHLETAREKDSLWRKIREGARRVALSSIPVVGNLARAFGFLKTSIDLAYDATDDMNTITEELTSNLNDLGEVLADPKFAFTKSWLWDMLLTDLTHLPEKFDKLKIPDEIVDDIEFPEFNLFGDAEDNTRKDKEYLKKRAEDWAASQKAMTDAERAQAEERNKIIDQSFSIASNIVTSFSSMYANQKAKELSMVGDNAKKREAIERKYAKKEQQMAIISAIISTAQGVARAFADFPFPYSIIPAAIVAGLGAAEISTIAGQEFAEGGSGLLDDKGGVLPGKRHSQGGVNLGAIGEGERGEYFGIVNRQMTKKYAGDLPNIFDSLNNGAFHEIWGRSNITTGDPYTKKMYELMQNTPVIIPEGKRIEKYPTGRTRIVNV